VPQNQGAAAKAAAVAKQQQDGKASKAQLKEKQVAIINLLRHPEEKIPRSFGEAPDIPGSRASRSFNRKSNRGQASQIDDDVANRL
jgi:hypothetical protein